MLLSKILAFSACGVFWGTSFLWIKICLEDISPLMLVTLRLLFGVLGLYIIFLFKNQRLPRDKKLWIQLAIVAMVSPTLPFFLITWGETQIPSSLASILNGTVPLFTVIFAHLFLEDEKFSLEKTVGLIVGFLGVYFLVGGNTEVKFKMTSVWGSLAVLLAASFYAASTVYLKKKMKNISPLIQSLCAMSFADVYCWSALLVLEPNFHMPTKSITWIGLLWMGILGTSVSFYAYFYLLHAVGAVRASLVNYMFPVIGLILGIIFLHEPVTLGLIIGATLIVSGIVIVNYKSLIKIMR